MCALAAGLFWHFSQAPHAETKRGGGRNAVPVKAEAARRADVPVYLSGLGTMQASATVTVRSRVDGELIEVGFKEGDTVEAGALIAQIDPRPFQAAMEQAEAKLAQDKSLLANARLDLDRYSRLAQKDFASEQKLDTQKASVAQLEAQIKGDQAALDNARTQLSYTTIRAPMRGRAGFLLVDKGNIVRASDPNGIVTIAQINPISAVFSLPERELPALARAARAGKVPAWALDQAGGTLEEGELSLIDNQIDQTSGTVKLKATFANTNGVLWPGQSVGVRVKVATLNDVVTVPEQAVQRGTDGLYAYIVKTDKTVEKRPLKVGVIDQGVAVVEDGIKAGETVVVSGQYKLKPGALVELGDETPVARNGAAS